MKHGRNPLWSPLDSILNMETTPGEPHMVRSMPILVSLSTNLWVERPRRWGMGDRYFGFGYWFGNYYGNYCGMFPFWPQIAPGSAISKLTARSPWPSPSNHPLLMNVFVYLSHRHWYWVAVMLVCLHIYIHKPILVSLSLLMSVWPDGNRESYDKEGQ